MHNTHSIWWWIYYSICRQNRATLHNCKCHILTPIRDYHRGPSIATRNNYSSLSAQSHHPCLRPSPDGSLKTDTRTTLWGLFPSSYIILKLKGTQYWTILHAFGLLYSTTLHHLCTKYNITSVQDTTHIVLNTLLAWGNSYGHIPHASGLTNHTTSLIPIRTYTCTVSVTKSPPGLCIPAHSSLVINSG